MLIVLKKYPINIARRTDNNIGARIQLKNTIFSKNHFKSILVIFVLSDCNFNYTKQPEVFSCADTLVPGVTVDDIGFRVLPGNCFITKFERFLMSAAHAAWSQVR